MDKEQTTKILSKIKDTVGENNYKLALAITGHRTGKIKDIIMCSKDGELLLEYIEHLEQQCKKQKEAIDKAIKYIDDLRDESAERQGFYNCFPDDLFIPDINELLDILKEVSEWM